MRHSKQTIIFADHLISYYAKLDRLSNSYTLSVDHIPDFDLHELAAHMMSESYIYAAEATGPDNEAYNKSMLTALMKFMHNTTDKDNQLEFVTTWKEGITEYYMTNIRELLNERLEQYNVDHGYIDQEDRGCTRDNGNAINIWQA